MNSKKLQWHPAFYAGIQIEFENETSQLIFENEHHLGTQPKRIDVLIIKKDDDSVIQKNIGKIFRRHNIIEFKSPQDYISINDYYLVYGYACLYKSDESNKNKIPIEDIHEYEKIQRIIVTTLSWIYSYEQTKMYLRRRALCVKH